MNSFNPATATCACQKCGNHWFSLKLAQKGKVPKQCPNCKRYDWRTPKTNRR